MEQAASPRLRQLQAMLQREPDDTFLLYGIALEYKKANQPAAAIEHLNRVIELDSGYCYAYHQRGLIYESMGEAASARQSYLEGIEAAKRKGDDHARGEIEAALSMIE